MIPGIVIATWLQNPVSDKVAPARANCGSDYSIGGVVILSDEKNSRHTVVTWAERGRLSAMETILQ